MTGPWSTLSGERVVSGSLWMPAFGAWVADVALALATLLPSPVTLTMGNISLVGTVVRSGLYASSRAYRIVGGMGGWRKNLVARAYANPAGVASSLVLGDLAIEAGETIVGAPSTMLGASYARLAGKASRTLTALASDWYVNASGATVIGTRVGAPIKSEFVPTNRHGAQGIVEIATEDPASWMPESTFTSPLLSSSILTISASRFFWDLDGRARVAVVVR